MLRRGRRRAPRLTLSDRLLCGFRALFLSSWNVSQRFAIALRSSTPLPIPSALVPRTFAGCSPPRCAREAGTEKAGRGTDPGHRRAQVAQSPVRLSTRARTISQTFASMLTRMFVYRVLTKHYRPAPAGFPPRLSSIGHAPDSLWSVDLFRCESIVLGVTCARGHGPVHATPRRHRRAWRRAPTGAAGVPDAQRRGFTGKACLRHIPRRHSMFRCSRLWWMANLRILEIDEIKTGPHVLPSHLFVERLIRNHAPRISSTRCCLPPR